MSLLPRVDFAIAGAGIIGLALALELDRRGAAVALLDIANAASGASSAAAGMLAADDPHNPPALHDLSAYSLSLYDSFLARIAALQGPPVPFQTYKTIQYLDDGSQLILAERSVDPRQLAAAALRALRSTRIQLTENCRALQFEESPEGVHLRGSSGIELHANNLVHASGAWFSPTAPGSRWRTEPITPRKGQMLRVQIPAGLPLNDVHRARAIYVVPRTHGPQAGTAVIGATDEAAGFDLTTNPTDLDRLRSAAAELIPALGDATASPQVEAWAGLRPATPDLLPLLGQLPGSARQWVASGHYRNGILLAPGTAAVIADTLERRQPLVDVNPFSPSRFL